MKKDKTGVVVYSGVRTDVHGSDVFVRGCARCNLSLDPIRMLRAVEASVTVLAEKNTLHAN